MAKYLLVCCIAVNLLLGALSINLNLEGWKNHDNKNKEKEKSCTESS